MSGTGFWPATRLVAQREINAQLRGKGFWITSAVFVIGLFAAAIIPGLLGDDSAPRVATVGLQAARVVATTDLDARPAANLDDAQALVRAGDVDAAVVTDAGSATGIRVVAKTQTPYEILAALAQTPPVDLLARDAVDDRVVYLASFAFALVSRMEDLSSSSSLVMILVLLPYLGVTFLQDNDLAMTVLSYVPFSAAVAMPVRMFAGEPQAWEPFVSMSVLAAAVVICVLVASRLYTGSLLQTGARVRLRRAWSGAETTAR